MAKLTNLAVIVSILTFMAAVETRAQNFSETFSSYSSESEAAIYGYTYTNVSLHNSGMTGNCLRTGTLSSTCVFTTGYLNLTGSNTITFDHRVSNTSSSPTMQVQLVAPDGTTSNISGGSFTYANNSVRNSTLNLGVSTTGWYAIRFTFSGSGGGSRGFIDQISSNIPYSSTTYSTTMIADIQLSASLDQVSYNIGDALAYTINVNNSGPNTADNPVVTLDIPASISVGSVVMAGGISGSYDAATETVTLNDVTNGTSGTITVNATAMSEGNFNIGATMTGLNFMEDYVGSNHDESNNFDIETGLLPVVFGQFSGKISNDQTILSWSTLQEDNADRFEIMRSTDGINFERIGLTSASGNSRTVKTYQFAAETAKSAVTYYQLVQVDHDGQSMKSAVISVRQTATASIEVKLYPNPVVECVSINASESVEAGQFYLMNASGQRVSISFEQQDNNQLTADLSQLPVGNYFIGSDQVKPIRIVKR